MVSGKQNALLARLYDDAYLVNSEPHLRYGISSNTRRSR